MKLINKLVKRLDSFLDLVEKSIETENKLIDKILSDDKINNKTLTLITKMQEINGNRIDSLNKYLHSIRDKLKNHTKKEVRKIRNPRKGKFDVDSLMDEYNDVAELETKKQFDNIAKMFDKKDVIDGKTIKEARKNVKKNQKKD